MWVWILRVFLMLLIANLVTFLVAARAPRES